MPRPQRKAQSRDRLGPYATPIPPTQPAHKVNSHAQSHLPFSSISYSTYTLPPRVPNSIRPLLNTSACPPRHPYMSRPGQQGSARPSGSDSGGPGNGYGYPAYSASGVSFVDGASLYTSASGHQPMQSVYGNPANHMPFAQQSQPQYAQRSQASDPALMTHSRRTSNQSPPLASSSTNAPHQLLADDGDDDGDAAGKRRRVQRACDVSVRGGVEEKANLQSYLTYARLELPSNRSAGAKRFAAMDLNKAKGPAPIASHMAKSADSRKRQRGERLPEATQKPWRLAWKKSSSFSVNWLQV